MPDYSPNTIPQPLESSAEKSTPLSSAVEKHSESKKEIGKYQKENPEETQEYYNNLTNYYTGLSHTEQNQDPTSLQRLQESISQNPIYGLQQEILEAEEEITEQLGLPRTSGYLFADFTPPEGDTSEEELNKSLWTHYEQKRIEQAESSYPESNNIVTSTLKDSIIKRIELQKYNPQPRNETLQRFEQEEKHGLETFFGHLNKIYNETGTLEDKRKILLLCQQISHFENNRLTQPKGRGEFRGTRLIIKDRRFWPIDTAPNMTINHNLKTELTEEMTPSDTQVENLLFVAQDSTEDEINTLLNNIPDYTLENQTTGEKINPIKNAPLSIHGRIETSRSNEQGKAEILTFNNGDTLVGETHVKNSIDSESEIRFNASLNQVNTHEHIILIEDYPSGFWQGKSLKKSFIGTTLDYAKENNIPLGTLEQPKIQEEVALEMQQLGVEITAKQLEKITGISIMLNDPRLPKGWEISQNLSEGMLIGINIKEAPRDERNMKYQQLQIELEQLHLSYIRDNRFINRIIETKRKYPERKLFIVTGSAHTKALEQAYRGEPRKQIEPTRVNQINNLIKELQL
jgi:hypothetical protein